MASPAGDDGDAHAAAKDIVRGARRFAAVHALVVNGCLDELRGRSLPVAELARRTGTDTGALHRVLRYAASFGVVRAVAPATYELTDVGAAMCADTPGSLRSNIVVHGSPMWWASLAGLETIVRTGQPTVPDDHDSVYDYLSANPVVSEAFNEHMRSLVELTAKELVTSYDLSGVRTLVDVGGGLGTVLAGALATYPRLRGVLFDREHVIGSAREFMAARGVVDRCEFVAGDFFASVPPHADGYLLGRVLHNWDDEAAVRLLRNVRRAMNPTGRVLLIEALIDEDDNAPDPVKDLDMGMLTLFDGGRERTEREHASLLDSAGLRLETTLELTRTPVAFSVLEAAAV